MNLFFTEMVHVVEDYGGVVEKNTGDGLMAYFVADPLWDCDVRQRAVAAALTMFSSANFIINPILELTPTDPVKFRVCMDYGWVSIARMGAAHRFNNIVAVGTTANIASKMLNFAGENSILLGDAMLGGLPPDWLKRFVQLKTEESGWIYRESNVPYRFWEYRGRWTQPQS
ncbi:adenylate/guanylate cyclase domain-containing protein [Parvibaculum sp.]|uniref:adenylate/guanylate cyclase domain-containing protein n=1 Tax=Parvibaculum sp. TaxID=2024848 RepID=UPI00391AE87E